jgi:hypothetical protein
VLLGKDPEFITMDFDDTWFVAVMVVFPNAMIIICTFHAIQLLTRGLLKELNHLQRKMNTIFIKECGIVRKVSLALEKSQPVKPLPVLTQDFCVKWLDFYQEINVVCKSGDVLSFMSVYHALIVRIRAWNQAIASKFEHELGANLSSFGINKQDMERLKRTLKTKWRGVLRDEREAREEKKREFADAKYLLLKKPVNLAKWENEKLDTFLKDNAWAITYRTALLQFYKLFEDSSCEDPSLDFLDAIVNKESRDELKAAVGTLKAKKKYIFNYVKALRMHPEWKNHPGFKLNPEPFMKRVNDLSRVQYGLRSDENAAYKLDQFLGCPVMQSQSVLNDKGGGTSIT